MHLWDKGGKTKQDVISFTCDRDRALDERLAVFDIIGSAAHAVMLGRCGIISGDETEKLLQGLAELYKEASSGSLHVDADHEDIHSVVEARLGSLIGEAAGKLHTGRSRNDQVLTDLHLWIRYQSALLAGEVGQLAIQLLDLSDRYKQVLMPGFTHLQPAMISSFGLWFASYAESLCDDLQMISNAVSFANASPLGSAAGYGTSLPVNREMTASLLQFERLIVTSPYSQASRGRTERTAVQAVASVANTLSRFASDVILFMSPGFGFISLSDEFTTGSSIMPQKKNPDLFELIRARSNRLQAVPNEVAMMTTGLPPGYNRDFQELKAVLFGSFDEIMDLITIIHLALEGIVVNMEIMNDEKYNSIFSVEEANKMVIKGVPFREAYRIVAGKVGSGLFEVPEISSYTHTGSIGNTGSGLIRERVKKAAGVYGFSSPEELFQSILPGK